MNFGFLARRGRKGKYLLLFWCCGEGGGIWRGGGSTRGERRRRRAVVERQHLSRACYVARRRVREFLHWGGLRAGEGGLLLLTRHYARRGARRADLGPFSSATRWSRAPQQLSAARDARAPRKQRRSCSGEAGLLGERQPRRAAFFAAYRAAARATATTTCSKVATFKLPFKAKKFLNSKF